MKSISGLRGIVGSTLTPEIIVKYASAFGEYCHGGKIVIGRDGRITGKPIAHIVSSTLLSMGCDVLAIGVAPTPTVQMAVRKSKSAGGISITASHNPMEWNGLKFIDATGLFLDSKQHEALWNIAEAPTRVYATWRKLGRHTADATFLDFHLRSILRIPYLNVRRIRARRFKVVLDCVNASGGSLVPNLLKKLGCRVVEMNCDVSGIFAHQPEPIPEHLTSLCRRVKKEGADLGIAVDPDADRLVLINERGEPLGEEYTIASVVKFVLAAESRRTSRRKKNRPSLTVVSNLSTTRAVDDIAREYGARSIRTPVGEINVAGTMKETGAIVGGEGSGGVILPSVHLGRDASVGIALTLQHLAEFGGPLSSLKATLPQYFIRKEKISLDDRSPTHVLHDLRNRYAHDGIITTDDGLKIDFSDSWVHLRASNTEPVIRIIAEAQTVSKAASLVKTFTEAALQRTEHHTTGTT